MFQEKISGPQFKTDLLKMPIGFESEIARIELCSWVLLAQSSLCFFSASCVPHGLRNQIIARRLTAHTFQQ